jgi:transcriptional regulator with XRE-family HTH domain
MIDDTGHGQPVIQHTLATNVRRMRIARSLSLSELARATPISKGTLSSIEGGDSNPTVLTLGALASALRVTVGELLAELEGPEVIVRRGAAAAWHEEEGVRVRELERAIGDEAAPVALREIEVPRGHRREHAPRPSRIGLLVISGTLIAGPVEHPTELAAGDYIAFAASAGYTLEAREGAVRAMLAEAIESA